MIMDLCTSHQALRAFSTGLKVGVLADSVLGHCTRRGTLFLKFLEDEHFPGAFGTRTQVDAPYPTGHQA